MNFGVGDFDTADVIPADFIEQNNGKNVYDIPDGAGDWMRSSPSSHNTYVSEENKRLARKLKPLIRFLKAWKYYCDVPISSFYLELRTTKLMENETSIKYDIDLCSIFKKLEICALASIQDPKGISGYIPACSSVAKKDTALSKLSTAVTRSQKARECEKQGLTEDAFYWWNKLFAEKFPNYYYY